jgi:hypothetical protein
MTEVLPQLDAQALGEQAAAEGAQAAAEAAQAQAQTEYQPRHAAELQNPDRLITRVANRVAGFAENVGQTAADHRTVGQVASETAVTIGESITKGREVAGKVGHSVLNNPVMDEIKFDVGNILTGSKELGVGIKDMGKEAFQTVRSKWQERATQAQERKTVRKEERTAKREARQYDKMRDDANGDNAKFDRKAVRAERRVAVKSAAKQIGKDALSAVGLVPYAAAAGAKKGAVRANQYLGSKVEAVVDYGTTAVDVYSESLKYKQEHKAKEADLQKSADWQKATEARLAAEAKLKATTDRKTAKITNKYNTKIK